MLNDLPGKNFRSGGASRQGRRSATRWNASRIVIVDPVLASRVELSQAVSSPGYLVESTSSIERADALLREHEVSLIIVDHSVDDRGGLERLTRLRESHPETRRALVTDLQDLEAIRPLLDAADLAFVVRKPVDAKALRRNVSAALEGGAELPGWRSVRMPSDDTFTPHTPALKPEPIHSSVSMPPHRELLVRGLLAGLNACDDKVGLFRLVHRELAASLDAAHSFWLDEKTNRVFSFSDDESEWGEREWTDVSSYERQVLAAARHVSAGARLEVELGLRPSGQSRDGVIGFSVHERGERLLTLVLDAPIAYANEALSILGALRSGLGKALRRIHQAEERAEAARSLARRVSDELRNPVAELTSAIASLRTEAARAGMSADWVDRVTSKSERLARAVRTVEKEMKVDPHDGSLNSF